MVIGTGLSGAAVNMYGQKQLLRQYVFPETSHVFRKMSHVPAKMSHVLWGCVPCSVRWAGCPVFFHETLNSGHEKTGCTDLIFQCIRHFSGFESSELLSQTKSLYDCTVSFDIAILDVVKQSTALTYQFSQSSCSCIILLV